MSDTAGHGNRATDAYPAVFLEAAKGAFAAAGVELVVRGYAVCLLGWVWTQFLPCHPSSFLLHFLLSTRDF